MFNHLLIVLGIGALLMMKKDSLTLGERNNNPLNIKYNAANQWRGQIGKNAGFVVFESPIYGFRAGAKILNSYANRGIKTLNDIISTFAPPTENDTKNYVQYVSKRTGIAPYDIVSRGRYVDVLRAMSKMETGKEWSEDTIRTGVALA